MPPTIDTTETIKLVHEADRKAQEILKEAIRTDDTQAKIKAERLQNCTNTVLSIAALYLRIPHPKVKQEHVDAIKRLQDELQCANMIG